MFCGSCGHKTESIECGLKRRCTSSSCAARFYPRVNPACIMLVRHPTDLRKCLLGRSKGWPPGMWSCLAGFLEVSESLEDAIVREVSEEAGISVDIERGVDILGSQPWPIGRNQSCDLMIGRDSGGVGVWAATAQIAVNVDEMEDIRWFDLSEVLEMLATPMGTVGKKNLPSQVAISHHLVRRWVDRLTALGH
ncbi:unnamed protein product [Polarella glacialis]|uniref:NAD(+) diphosphatase n=1 Tax=Polarella glacialis TaxID=89957 RepID=A0A813FI26_POLGL|nr:unnamed protein product [Polarella glacialis]